MQIIDVDEKNQLLVTNIWLKLEWNDVNLRWNSSEYGGIKDLRIPPHRIWKPDVLMYNSADEGFDGTYPTNVVVRSNGSCLYVPPGIFKSTCKIDITWFPFDDQKCEMKFGSWTYDGFQLDLQLQDEGGGDLSSFITNGEWDLLSVPGKRNQIYYTCCPEPYIDITYSINIRRRTLYYFFNLIVPCVLIASMAVLGFTLPPDSGEKLSLGTYFNCIMFMVASSVVSTIMILNYHHRNADTHEMSTVIRLLYLKWLPKLLGMSRPGEDEKKSKPVKMPATAMQAFELRDRSSKSLLANVLDIDDDFRNHGFHTNNVFYKHDDSTNAMHATSPGSMSSGVQQIAPQRELLLILKELRQITDKIKRDEEADEITNDWKYAAMVIDRLCLILFTFFTIIATIAVLFSAPHIIVS